MAPPRTDTPAFALAQGFFNDCRAVHEFMNDVALPILVRHADSQDPLGGVGAAFHRAMYWLSTMGKLNHPSDFQAAVAGVRALFEITVDLTLIVGDRDKYPIKMLMLWEESAKLKHAESMVQLAQRAGVTWDARPFADYLAVNKENVRQIRLKLWPNKKGNERHPDRWTGRNLAADAAAADALGGRDLEDFYRRRFGELCWWTHGSGLVGARHIDSDSFPGIVAFALKEAADFGMRISKLSLQYLGAFDPVAEVKFEQGERDRVDLRVRGYAHKKSQSG